MQRNSFPTLPRANTQSIIRGDTYRFTILTEGLLRYEYAPDGRFEDRASTFAINRHFPKPEFRYNDRGDEGFEVATAKYQLFYDKKAFTASGLTAQLLGNITDHKSRWRYGEPVIDLGGTARTLDDVDGRTPLEPGIISSRGYAVVDDSNSFLFEDDGWVASRQPGERRIDGYLFAYGHDYHGAIRAFYALSGQQPLLPRWALGNWWSRYYAYKDEEYINLMDEFRDSGVPVSVGVLDMDWHLVATEAIREAGVSGWTGYTWNKGLFPDPKGFCDKLHKRRIKITLNDHPADGIQSYEDLYEDMSKALNHDTSYNDPIAFDIANRAFCDAYFDILHRRLEEDGVDFWWIDWQQGSYSRMAGVDPLWMLNHYHFLDSGRDCKRPITFSRYAGPGSHRYPVGFSGDTVVSWASLDFQPEFTNTASNIGYGWWSHDIGGHMFGGRDDELATRWVQYGVFSPIMRLHSSSNPWNTKEPWKFNVEARDIQVEYLRFRHKLMPYLYSMNVRAATKGEPLCQPMYWQFPQRTEAYTVPNQYNFGSELVVVPITQPRDSETRLGRAKGWLPPGKYVDIFTGAVYDGSRELWFQRPLDLYPVLAKEGSILPLDAAAEPKNGCPNPEEIEVIIVVGRDGYFELVEDNDTGSSVDSTIVNKTTIKYAQQTGTVEIIPGDKIKEAAVPGARTWTLRFLACSLPDRNIEANEIALSIEGKDTTIYPTLLQQPSQGFLLSLGSVPSSSFIRVNLMPLSSSLACSSPSLVTNDVAAYIYPILQRAQIKFGLKEAIWNAVAGGGSRIAQIAKLLGIEMERKVMDAIMEHLTAQSGEWKKVTKLDF